MADSHIATMCCLLSDGSSLGNIKGVEKRLLKLAEDVIVADRNNLCSSIKCRLPVSEY